MGGAGMAGAAVLTQTRIRAGVWQGVLSGVGAEVPQLEVFLLEQQIAGVTITPLPDQIAFLVEVPIPAEVLNEGVQTFVIRRDEETLAHFTIVTGVVLEDDLRAEVDLLRAELDLLKRAFRRHCLETK